MNTNTKKIKLVATSYILFAIGLSAFYGGKHIAHVKCVEGALEMQCKKIRGFSKIVSIDVPWWKPLPGQVEYNCSARLSFEQNEKDVEFVARRVTAADGFEDISKAVSGQDVEDNWEVNMGFWGWLGDDYRILDLKAK